MRKRIAAIFLLALAPAFLPAVSTGVFAQAAAEAPAYKSVLIENVPHVKQKPDFCGEACIEMWTSSIWLRKPITQDQVFNISGVKALAGRGCVTADMQSVLAKIGFQPGPVWFNYDVKDPAKGAAALEAQFAAMHADLAAGTPSIVCMHYNDAPQTTEHFRLILGYDSKTDEVIYNEPAEDNGAYRRMSKALFMKLWPLSGEKTARVAIRLSLKAPPNLKILNVQAAQGFTDADYAQHMMVLKGKVPPRAGFNVMIQKPFVIISDEPEIAMKNHAERTVKWAVDKLKADFFAKEPADILDIWLFKDKTSYDKYTKEIFGDTPTTPYGYYSPAAKALIMNIATGGGTLVHEIVHPFMATNFPECPAWFNEGMGSLFEQCGDRNGHIIGYTNWRLAGLQKALGGAGVPSFEKFCAQDTRGFYGDDRGTNYAQARYLLYYLQEKGLLIKYYKEFTASAKDDPTGYKSLMKVLGESDMEKFKAAWEKYVLALKFP